MILQALKDYYDRKAADPDSQIAPEGWEWKEIPFVIVLDEEGQLVQIEDTREGEGKKKRGKRFLVPHSVKKTSGVAANLLWDPADYALGIQNLEELEAGKKEKAIARLVQKKRAFRERVEQEVPESPRRTILLNFLEHVPQEELACSPHWEEILNGALLSFRFSGERELFCSTLTLGGHKTEGEGEAVTGFCPVAGKKDNMANLHNPIKNLFGAQTTGANIVSFNLRAFASYGKSQGWNAPIGESAMFAYTTALNTLLRNNQQKWTCGGNTVVFWSQNKTAFEDEFLQFFTEPSKEDPDACTRSVASLFRSVESGGYLHQEGDQKFFILGLSPNASRIAIRFWRSGTVADFATHIRTYFQDLEMVKPEKEPRYYSLWRLLVNIATQDKSENIPPNLMGEMMTAILDGGVFPQTLLQATLRRIASDAAERVKPVRAALLKAYLNRYHRTYPHSGIKEIHMSLDTEQPSVGYQLGRLFATLEKIQEEGNPGLNATIRERYYGSACSAPVTVFGTLMRLKNHHLAKIEKGRSVNLERWVGEIVGHFQDFPAHLDLHEQARFAVGYYHQRQAFFTRKEKDNTNTKEGEE